MTDGSLDLQTLAHRLEKLEHQKSRRNVFLVLPLLIFSLGGVSVATVAPPKILTAEKIILVDHQGMTRLTLGLEHGTPHINMTYPNGDPCLQISEGKLCFYDQDKKARINIMAINGLNFSSLCITDKTGKNCVSLTAGDDGPYLSIDDNAQEKSVVLSIDPIGTLNSLESCTPGPGQSPQNPQQGSAMARVDAPPH
jgi:hypothetical protein